MNDFVDGKQFNFQNLNIHIKMIENKYILNKEKL